MNEQEIIEGKKLIAEFRGLTKCTHKDHADNPCYYMSGWYSSIRFAKYNTSFDWLMPVIKQIQLLEIKEFNKKVPVMNALMDVDIEILFLAAIVFIKWYNTTIPS